MSERETIGKKLRFEVLKRDGFTCQYCGRKAPDVVLQIDHVRPVAGGGTTDILNLVTSCWECNSGKGKRELTDHALLNQTRDQMAELEERRQQIEMMIQWQEELRNLDTDALDRVCQKIGERGGFVPNESGRADVRRWLKRFSLAELMRAIDEAFDAYAAHDKNCQVTSESWNLAFRKIPGVASILRQEEDKPYLRRLLYIQGIIRRKIKSKHYDCFDYLEHLILAGADIEDMEVRAKRMRRLEDFDGHFDAWLDSIGDPF